MTAITGGILFEGLLGLPFWYGALGLVLLTGVFTIFGGMKGVITKKVTPKAGEIGLIVGFLIGMVRLAIMAVCPAKVGSPDFLDYPMFIQHFLGINWLWLEIYLLIFTMLLMVTKFVF